MNSHLPSKYKKFSKFCQLYITHFKDWTKKLLFSVCLVLSFFIADTKKHFRFLSQCSEWSIRKHPLLLYNLGHHMLRWREAVKCQFIFQQSIPEIRSVTLQHKVSLAASKKLVCLTCPSLLAVSVMLRPTEFPATLLPFTSKMLEERISKDKLVMLHIIYSTIQLYFCRF